jgi:hypothetical protein
MSLKRDPHRVDAGQVPASSVFTVSQFKWSDVQTFGFCFQVEANGELSSAGVQSTPLLFEVR